MAATEFGIFSTRQGTGIWHFHAEVKSSSEDIKLRCVIGVSLMFFLEEQAASSPGLTKDWSPWCSIENPENRWTALVTSPFIIPFWVITCHIMLVLFFMHQKQSQAAPRLKVRLSLSAPQSHGLPNKRASFRRGLMTATEFWHLFYTEGNWKLIIPCRNHKLQHVIGFSLMFFGRTSCPRPWSDKVLKPLAQHWKPWKPLNGLGNFAFYHPFLSYNMSHHVGSVLQALKPSLSCSKVNGPTSLLSAAIPWSSEQTCPFSARFDGCNRILASFLHGRELKTDNSMQKSNHPVKTLNFGMSSDSLWCFLEEQAARSPGLTKDWSPWRSIENPEKRWMALVTSPFVSFYHPFLSSNMLHHVGAVLQALKAFSSCSKVEGLTFPLSAAIPWSSKQTCKFSARFDGCNRIWHLFDTAGNWNLILPSGRQIIQKTH